jgi:hypothetical protein
MSNFLSDNINAESIRFTQIPQPYNAPDGTLWWSVADKDLEILFDGKARHIPTTKEVPVTQNSLLKINTNQIHTVSNLATVTSLYNIAIFLESRADGGPSDTLLADIIWTAPDGDTNITTIELEGVTDNIQQENYVFLCTAGTPITVNTTFSAGIFHYDIAVAITILPTGV